MKLNWTVSEKIDTNEKVIWKIETDVGFLKVVIFKDSKKSFFVENGDYFPNAASFVDYDESEISSVYTVEELDDLKKEITKAYLNDLDFKKIIKAADKLESFLIDLKKFGIKKIEYNSEDNTLELTSLYNRVESVYLDTVNSNLQYFLN